VTGIENHRLRPHLIWGPADNHLVPRIIARAKSLRRVGDGSNRVDTIYVDNAARAHLLAMEALEKNRRFRAGFILSATTTPSVCGRWSTAYWQPAESLR
jgi:nucleoside-diphosphate-sugar epimerase